ncbi:hydroxyacylglutathione hydrolase [Alloalcanivorax mobilis]|uniref:hydroxyacylglutathione hydrolase n=1 Tax=Alloalcanivorax mobilis TaxID=2019569 RepID=UPI000C76689E|nr:hydroxyacylglutathione hydrolase [Alloalcanivorax mobilis]
MLKAPTAIPAFRDNYIWAIVEGDRCVVVDPGDAAPVEAWLSEQGLTLSAILITHHHPDHVGGVSALCRQRSIPVYGPARESIPEIGHPLNDGDRVRLSGPDLELDVLEVPGHTLGHIAFYAAGQGWLFCGDTLFAGGCGRLFEGTPEQMHHSLTRLAALPEETRVFCAHEYTLANLTFAASVSPQDNNVLARLEQVRALREQDRITLPSTIGEERRTNPFLRSAEPQLRHACETHFGVAPDSCVENFAALRRWKDSA